MTEAKSADRAVQADRERLFVIAKFIWLIENQLVMRTSQLKLAVTFSSRSACVALASIFNDEHVQNSPNLPINFILTNH